MKRRGFISLLGSAAAWPIVELRHGHRPDRDDIPPWDAGCRGRRSPPTVAWRDSGQFTREARLYARQNSSMRLAAQRAKRQVPQLMLELKAAKVDVVVTVSYPAAVAAKTSGIPTVIASGSGDPVATGLVESLPQPGGNVTGIADDASLLSTKRLSLLRRCCRSFAGSRCCGTRTISA